MSSETTELPTMDSFNSSVDIPTSRTYTSDLITNFDSLDLEYETFNGSVTEFADKIEHPLTKEVEETTPGPEDYTFVEHNETNETNEAVDQSASMGSLVYDTTVESEAKNDTIVKEDLNETDDSKDEMQTLNVLKNRSKDQENIVLGEEQLARIRRVSSQFTATKITNENNDPKVSELSKLFEEISTKVHKIEKEIKFIDSILPTQPLSQMSIEFQKLSYGRSKLFDKCEALKKQRYELSIKLNHKLKKIYGENSDKTEFWIRGFN